MRKFDNAKNQAVYDLYSSHNPPTEENHLLAAYKRGLAGDTRSNFNTTGISHAAYMAGLDKYAKLFGPVYNDEKPMPAADTDGVEIIVDPDTHHILSVVRGQVLLLGHIGYAGSACILMVSRATYHAAIDDWLDRKADYGARNEFAGVGNIVFEDATETKHRYYLAAPLVNDGGTDWGRTINVKTFKATAFMVDMEHG